MNPVRVLFSIHVSLLIAAFAIVEPCAAESTLTIHIEGFETNEGLARIVLFDSQASYKGSAPPFRVESVPIQERRAIWSADELPAGSYVAIVHHDANANDDLDRPYFSLPLEPYGYSNDAFKTLGIPAFELVEFTLVDGSNVQNITIRYNPIAASALSLQPFRNLIMLTLVLVLPLLVCAGLRRWLGPWASDSRRLARFGLTLLLFMTSSAHFANAAQMMLMLPDWVPARMAIIYATGVMEIALAIGLWVPGLTQRVGVAIALMLVCFLPANIYSAMIALPFGGAEIGPSYLLVRIPYQLFLVWWTFWATGFFARSRNESR
jgi:uncharacterized protein (DUF2141 family)/uncharacterized membrane protein